MNDERFYSRDLAIYYCPGKWKTAKRLVHRQKPELDGLPYWMEVRLCFLELGGYYWSQLNEHGQPQWNHHPA